VSQSCEIVADDARRLRQALCQQQQSSKLQENSGASIKIRGVHCRILRRKSRNTFEKCLKCPTCSDREKSEEAFTKKIFGGRFSARMTAVSVSMLGKGVNVSFGMVEILAFRRSEDLSCRPFDAAA
jgi:hypothetical protein